MKGQPGSSAVTHNMVPWGERQKCIPSVSSSYQVRQKCVSPFSSDPRIRVPPSQGPPSPRLLTASKSLVAERSRTLVPTVMPGTNLTEEAEGQGQTDRQRPREGSEEVSRERPDLPGPLGVSVPRPEEPVPCSRPGFRMSPKQTWPRAGWERAHGATRVPAGSASLARTLCMARSI